jgi:hypothetical protein
MINTICSSDSDCGSASSGSPYCSGSQVVKDVTIPSCNAGTSCSNQVTQQVVATCTSSQVCQNAACISNTCSSSSDCGSVTKSALYCSGNSIVQDVMTPSCSGAGTSSSLCTSSKTTQTIESCVSGKSCVSGACVNTTQQTSSATTETSDSGLTTNETILLIAGVSLVIYLMSRKNTTTIYRRK